MGERRRSKGNYSGLRLVSVTTYVTPTKTDSSHPTYRPSRSSKSKNPYDTYAGTPTDRVSSRRHTSYSQAKPTVPSTSRGDENYRESRHVPSTRPRTSPPHTTTEFSAHSAKAGEGAELCPITEDMVKKLGPSTGGDIDRMQSWVNGSSASVYPQEFLDVMRDIGAREREQAQEQARSGRRW